MAKKTAAEKQREAFLKAQSRATGQQQSQVNQAQQTAHPFVPAAQQAPSVKGQGVPAPAQLPPGMVPIAPQPFDPDFEARKLESQWTVGLSDAEAGYQRGNLAYDSGYDANGLRNAANPYSQAQLLEDNFRRAKLGAQNSYAAMGQFNSGAYGRAQGREDRLYAQDSNALQLGTQRGYHGIGVGQLQTYAGNSAGVGGDAYASLKRSVYGS